MAWLQIIQLGRILSTEGDQQTSWIIIDMNYFDQTPMTDHSRNTLLALPALSDFQIISLNKVPLNMICVVGVVVV